MIVIKNNGLRKAVKIAIPFLLIPAAIAAGIFLFDEKQYAFISLTVAILSLALFIAGFEKRQTGTRRLIIVAVMVAFSVVGRFIPLFKPITALTIITAIYLGGEAGFMVGSLSAVISNFYFGQGPWTPFQMFSWGMIGLIAGFLYLPLKKSRVFLLVFGFLSGIIYSIVMDSWTVLWYNQSFDLTLYLAALGTALPYTIMYSVSNVIFLVLFAKPFGEKLERIKLKYGI
ncbi:MAG TPA: ECF transporter S component [Oscillospiraceae bacterium]|nr:ECF transporter S component [Oscillospiraceae bacterium]HPS34006.1 ECF transporter S component [Oscillospiraceae bacterium]